MRGEGARYERGAYVRTHDGDRRFRHLPRTKPPAHTYATLWSATDRMLQSPITLDTFGA